MKTKERFNTTNDIILGIARRSAYKFKTKTVDELSQELWVTVLEKERKVDHDLDFDLIAKICYDKVVDLQRYESRRNCISIEELMVKEEEDEKLLKPTTSRVKLYSKFEDPDNITKTLLKDLINIFPKDSKERTFLEYWSSSVGFMDYDVDGNGKFNGGYTESDLAHKLGYSGTSSGGYKKFRSKMRTLVVKVIKD